MRKNSASFRDPSGFIFTHQNSLFRQVNRKYKDNYDLLRNSGLYEKLVSSKYLISHEEIKGETFELSNEAYKIIKPERISFISYPYEWCFSQWKDAALLTLEIQKIALAHGMSLKDASAFNIQFHEGKPILIDTLSFEKYEEGKPWIAYRQFVEHFLSPLALISLTDSRLGRLLALYIDGIPLNLAAKLLPLKSRLNPGLFFHIYLHSHAQGRYHATSAKQQRKDAHMSKQALLGLIDNLKNTINKLVKKSHRSTWGSYYADRVSYTKEAIDHKKALIEKIITRLHPSSVWDIGGNTGYFSRITSRRNIPTISFDIDREAVEENYRLARENNEKYILPLILDITNPTPPIGWGLDERFSLFQRGPADTIMALALIHHIAIGHNVPFSHIAKIFASLCTTLIIEYVPKKDPQVQKLLERREDIFPQYTQIDFEQEFGSFFSIKQHEAIKDSSRILYWMTKKKIMR